MEVKTHECTYKQRDYSHLESQDLAGWAHLTHAHTMTWQVSTPALSGRTHLTRTCTCYTNTHTHRKTLIHVHTFLWGWGVLSIYPMTPSAVWLLLYCIIFRKCTSLYVLLPPGFSENTLKMERSVVKGSTQYLCTSAFNWKVILATTLLLNFLICCLFFLSNLLFYFQATYQVVREQEAIVLRMFEWLAPLRNTNKSGLLRFARNDTVEIFTRLRIAIWVGKNCMITV